MNDYDGEATVIFRGRESEAQASLWGDSSGWGGTLALAEATGYDISNSEEIAQLKVHESTSGSDFKGFTWKADLSGTCTLEIRGENSSPPW